MKMPNSLFQNSLQWLFNSRDCVHKDAALQENFEADKFNQMVGK